MSYNEIILRILLSSLAGVAIGYNREKINRPAGIRTHALLSLGACVLTILSLIAFYDPINKAGDPGRIAAQIVSGIGFLGAGTILKNGNKVKGLTTAATLWVSASIGMTFGAGKYYIGLISLIVTLLILYINKFSKHSNDEISLEIVLNNNKNIDKIISFIENDDSLILKNIDFSQKDNGILYFTFKNYSNKSISELEKQLIHIDNISNINLIEDN